jgi:hypothetical protein
MMDRLSLSTTELVEAQETTHEPLPSDLLHPRQLPRFLLRASRMGEGTYMTTRWFRGVWLSDTPLATNEGTADGPLLSIGIPENEIAECEWVNEAVLRL